MTLDQAIFELHRKGLPSPSAISVFFLYLKKEDCYYKSNDFEVKFHELLKVQKTIQESHAISD
jgi:hypothetical protein